MTSTLTCTDTLNDLIALAENGRLDRSEDRPCRTVRSDTHAWKGEVVGERGRVVYHPRIKVVGGRSFGCTCPDHLSQRGAVGPCKHVLSLAKAALEEIDLLARFGRV